MTVRAQLHDGTTLEFPDGTSDDVVASTVKRLMAEPKPAEKPAMGWGEYADNVVRQVANGVTFGLADEIAAKADELTGRGKGYDTNLAAERTKDKAFEAEYPVAATAAQIGGGLLTGGAGAAKAAGAQALKAIPTFAKATAAGAGVGALTGFGSAEGGLGNRLEGGATGGAVGGVVGAAAPFALKAIGTAVSPITSRFQPAEKLAQSKIAQALERDGLTPDAVSARMKDLGPDAVLADAGGENLMGLTRAAASIPGKTKNVAADVLNARQEGQGARILAGAERNLDNTADFYSNVDDLIARRESAARPLYDKVMKPDNLVPEDKFAAIASDPFMANTIKSVKGDDLYGMSDLADNSLPVLDAAKKRLDDLIESAKRGGENNRARLLTERKQALVGAADEAFPDYAAARAAWEGPSRAMDALNQGREFIKSDAEVTVKAMAKMSDTDQEFFRAGVVRQIRDSLYNTDDGVNAVRRLFGNKMKREKLAAAFPDERSFRDFERTMQNEATFFQTRAKVLQGSRTTPLKEEIDDMGGGGLLGPTVAAAARGNLMGAAGNLMGAAMNRLSAPRESVANALTDTLLKPQPNQQQFMAQLLRNPTPLANSDAQRAALAAALAGETGRWLAPTYGSGQKP